MRKLRINKRIRLLAIKRILKKLGIEYDRRNQEPYGYADPYEIYKQIEYWQDRREELTKQNMKDL